MTDSDWIKDVLEDQIRANEEHLGRGAAETFEDYTAICGKIRGFREAIQMIKDREADILHSDGDED